MPASLATTIVWPSRAAPTSAYVVQYRESEMDFISRLMEEEGIFFFFEHAVDGHVMVIGDSPVAHTTVPDADEFAFRDQIGLVSEEEQEYIYNIRDGQWDNALLDEMGIPLEVLPAVVSNSQIYGETGAAFGPYKGTPISGMAGDQQAALFGQTCFREGMAKNTYPGAG